MAIEYPPRYPSQEQPKSERERLDMVIAEKERNIKRIQEPPNSALLGGGFELALDYQKKVLPILRAELEELKQRRDELDGQPRQESEVKQVTPNAEEQISGAGEELATQETINATRQNIEDLYNDSETNGSAS